MTMLPIRHFFRLGEEGVRCDERGMFVGGAPMLAPAPAANGERALRARSIEELNRDLGACYRLPIDAAAKCDRLDGIAKALNHGDLALAQIATLLLRFPDPPPLTKDLSGESAAELARQLADCDLLKADWDPAKHPRTGEAPNPGWFAPKDEGEIPGAENNVRSPPTMTDEPPKPSGAASAGSEGSPPIPRAQATSPTSPLGPEKEPKRPNPAGRDIMRSLREFLKREAFPTIRAGEIFRFWASEKIQQAITNAIANLRNEVVYARAISLIPQVLLEEAFASADLPKSLDELQANSGLKGLGYDDHHLVQANPSNVTKECDIFIRFGSDVINDPSNIVRIPRVKHRLITDYYNETDFNDAGRRRRRQVESDKDFNTQREDALKILRMFGVLE